MLRRLRRLIAKLTGVEAALQRRVTKVEAQYRRIADQAKSDAAAQTQRAALVEHQLKAQVEETVTHRQRADRAERLADHYRQKAPDLKLLATLLEVASKYEYGSLVPGVEDWSDKWRQTSGLKILMYATKDYAGSFYRWADAINRHTDHAARLVVSVPHPFGYPMDLLMLNPKFAVGDWARLWREADILHLKDEHRFVLNTNQIPPELILEFKGPKVFTQYGGYARKLSGEEEYRQLVHRFETVVCMTPDLAFQWLGEKTFYVPHAVDVESAKFCWKDTRVIGHSPSNRERKGTHDFLAAMERIQRDHVWDIDLMEGIPHDEVLERKKKVGLFFDQAGSETREFMNASAVVGWYGNSALEAAAFGVPTIAHMSQFALTRARQLGAVEVENSPFINSPLGVDGIESVIRGLIEMTPDHRAHLAKRTRQFVEHLHGMEPVAAKLHDVYVNTY